MWGALPRFVHARWVWSLRKYFRRGFHLGVMALFAQSITLFCVVFRPFRVSLWSVSCSFVYASTRVCLYRSKTRVASTPPPPPIFTILQVRDSWCVIGPQQARGPRGVENTIIRTNNSTRLRYHDERTSRRVNRSAHCRIYCGLGPIIVGGLLWYLLTKVYTYMRHVEGVMVLEKTEGISTHVRP